MSCFEVPEPRSARLIPELVGRRVALRPVRPPDYDYLFDLSTRPENLVGWRFRGSPPSPDAFRQTLFQGVLAQFLVTSRKDGRPVGLVSAYDANFRNQLVYLALLTDPRFARQGWVMEGGLVFAKYVFDTWSFRKIYLESAEFNYKQFASGAGHLFTVEGCLQDFEFHDGRYWHKYIASLSKEAFLDWFKRHRRLTDSSLTD